MPTYFQRPENALKRANELIDVGKQQRALDALYDVIKSKKHRTWQKIHEPIMEKYLELCVALRKSHIAKEGLYQYKFICQQVNIGSLVDVVRKYIAMAEHKTEEAREASHQSVLDIDDLDQPDSPESILLKAVSGEDTQDRADRAILTPWVKFLWESYRQCLDLLRNNSRVESLYQDIAQQAFKFCLKYARKTEFRKLCDNLRIHLGHVHKYQHQQSAINLNNPESQAMHLETRLVQLDSAINMDLWQEAFKAVEDIHGLISLSKKTPKPVLMANYYSKLAMVFWKSGNQLFHACALHRLFHLTREQKKTINIEEMQKLATRVLLATIAVPIVASRNPIDDVLQMEETSMEKKRRLATLLMLQTPPTRHTLVSDVMKYNLLQYVNPALQQLYQKIEIDFNPLHLATSVSTSMEFIEQNEHFSQYVAALEDIITTRVLKQVAQIYQTIEFSHLKSFVPFVSEFRLERAIVDAAKILELQVRVDHRTRSVSFGTDLMVAQREDVPEGPSIQNMPSENLRSQLTAMAQALQKAIQLIQPERHSDHDNIKRHIIESYRSTSRKEHARILERRQIIEERKEKLEHMNVQREREEQVQQQEQQRRAYDAEMARLEREALERERQRQVEETKLIQKRHAKERLNQLKQTDIGAKVLKNMDEEELEELDVDEIMQKQVEHLEKEKKELQERLKSQDKRVDYMARARRIEEIPVLQQQYEEEGVKRQELWVLQETERIEDLKQERDLAMDNRDRLRRMITDKNAFMNSLKSTRTNVYKSKLADFERNLAEERKKRIMEHKRRRKVDRRQKWIQEREVEKQRIIDEQLIKERDEKERVDREMCEAEKQAFLEQEKQRAREKEIEERETQRREDSRTSRGRDDFDGPRRTERDGYQRSERFPESGSHDKTGSEAVSWRAAPLEGGWREREKQRERQWSGKRDDEPAESRAAPQDDRNRGPLRDDRDRGAPEPREIHDERSPRDEPESRWSRDDRGPRDDRDRGGARDFRGPRDDRDFRGLRDDRDRGGSSRDFRDPPRDDRDFRGGGPPPRDDRDGRGFQDRDFRGPSRDDRDRGGRDFRSPPPRDDFRSQRDDRGPPRDDRGLLRDDRGPPRDDRDSRGPPRDFRRSDDRGPRRDEPRRDEPRSWRDRPPAQDDKDWGSLRRGPATRDDDRQPQDDSRRGDDQFSSPREGPWKKDYMPRDVRRDEPAPPRRDFASRDIRRDEPPAPRRDFGSRDIRRDEPPPPKRDDDRKDMRRDMERLPDDGPARGLRGDGPPRESPWKRGPERDERESERPEYRQTVKGGEQQVRQEENERGGTKQSDQPADEEDDGWTTVRR